MSVVLAFFVDLSLLVALHSNVFVLYVLFPVIMMEVVSAPAMIVMSVDPTYQVMVGSGTALLLISHLTSL